MTQLNLPMLTLYEGPKLLDHSIVSSWATYRDAVKGSHQHRKRRNLTNRQLAEESGAPSNHITAYLHDAEYQRELPAKYIPGWEIAVGNRGITQWIALQAHLTILETFIQARAA